MRNNIYIFSRCFCLTFFFFLASFFFSFDAFLAAQQPSPYSDSLTYNDIFNPDLQPKSIEAFKWSKDGKSYTTLTNQEIRRYSFQNDLYDIVISSSELSQNRKDSLFINGYFFSKNEEKILLKTNSESIWRRSERSHYFVYDIKARTLHPVVSTDYKDIKIYYASFAPDDSKVAFVRENNLYYYDLNTKKEIQITTDGKHNHIINGISDWVYEEEFGFSKAFFWSPDGSKIAFYRFDESDVKEFTMTLWGEGKYPSYSTFKYPKVGEKNALVQIGVYDLKDQSIVWIPLSQGQDTYIPRIKWTRSSNILSITQMNRFQNKLNLLFANTTTGELTPVFVEEQPNGWIDVNDHLYFLKDGSSFLYTTEESGYNHIYLYSTQGRLIRQVTRGNWEVTAFYGYDEVSNQIFFQSSEESPLERHIYSISLDGSKKKKLSSKRGWYSANMSPNKRFYVSTYSSKDTPPVYTLCNNRGQTLRLIEDNNKLIETLSRYPIGKKEFYVIPTEKETLNSYILYPYDFNPEKKYPVLMYVYGGPGSQTVKNEYEGGSRAMWHHYLTTLGYLVVSVDNSGTGGRGSAFKQQVYLKLGQHEVSDQIEAAQFLSTLPYVDSERIGIWGWSYGGYMSTLCLAQGSEIFKSAIAVAPVTLWHLYDTIYTERFMHTPRENKENYVLGSPIFHAQKIKGNYLLIHGSADDNVHLQNSMYLASQLINFGITFDFFVYPDSNHGIYYQNARRHLYKKMTNFITEKL